MKTFRYGHGPKAGSTMTVAELKDKLAEYPDDMPVFGGWEGVHGYIRADSFDIELVSTGYPGEECECLVIDVEDY